MKTLRKWAFMALAIGIAIPFTSCEKEDKVEDPISTDTLSEYVAIGTEALPSGDATVKLYFHESAFVGYNEVAVRITNSSNTIIEDALVSFLPMMDMGTMMHSAPFENPTFDADMEAYMGTTTFIMPSGMAGSWTFSVMVEINGQAAEKVTFAITVDTKTEAKLFNFVSAIDPSESYFVALKEPRSPMMGLNDFELMIYKRESMMSFPAATNLKIEIEPEMPSMGHGSPNNENPIHVADGLYKGKVNFTMTGYWKVNVKIMDDNDAILKEDGFFDITF